MFRMDFGCPARPDPRMFNQWRDRHHHGRHGGFDFPHHHFGPPPFGAHPWDRHMSCPWNADPRQPHFHRHPRGKKCGSKEEVIDLTQDDNLAEAATTEPSTDKCQASESDCACKNNKNEEKQQEDEDEANIPCLVVYLSRNELRQLSRRRHHGPPGRKFDGGMRPQKMGRSWPHNPHSPAEFVVHGPPPAHLRRHRSLSPFGRHHHGHH